MLFYATGFLPYFNCDIIKPLKKKDSFRMHYKSRNNYSVSDCDFWYCNICY